MSDNNKIKVTLNMRPDSELLDRRGLKPGGKVQMYIDSEVLRCCDGYIPMQTGMLKKSGTLSTVVGSGMVHWETPYGKKVYYQNSGNGIQGTNNGGKRGRLWFERMKPDYLPKILSGVKRIAGAK